MDTESYKQNRIDLAAKYPKYINPKWVSGSKFILILFAILLAKLGQKGLVSSLEKHRKPKTDRQRFERNAASTSLFPKRLNS